MSATVLGTAYLFSPASIGGTYLNADGSTATTGLTAKTLGVNLREAPANRLDETDLAGNVFSIRRDDITITGTIEIAITAASTAWPVTTGRVTLADHTDTRWNVKYLIEDVSPPIRKGAHIIYTLTLLSNAVVRA